MNAIETARTLLPAYVGWVNVFFVVSLSFLSAFVMAWVAIRIASKPLRKQQPESWAERARLAFPVRVTSGVCLLVFPSVVMFATWSCHGPMSQVSEPLFSIMACVAASGGAGLAAVRASRRLGLRRWSLGYQLRGIAVLALIFVPHFIILVLLAILLPDAITARAAALLAAAVALLIFFIGGGGLFIARALGLARPASARLAAIVAGAAARTGIYPRAAYEIVWPGANALALIFCRRLAFTELAVDALTDEELDAVCLHELEHLGESRIIKLARILPVAFLLPLAGFRPILGTFGIEGFFVGTVLCLVLGLVVSVAARRLARRMEEKADRGGYSQEKTPGVYARALEKLYEVNQVPVVMGGKLKVHPNLYDRMIAAGIQPTYDRPKPPARFRPYVALFVAGLLGGIIAAGVAGGLAWAKGSLRQNEAGLVLLMALDGGDDRAFHDLAALRYQRGDVDSAIVLYQAACDLDPASAYYSAKLAIALARAGRCDEADDALDEAERRLDRTGNIRRASRAIREARKAVEECQAPARSCPERSTLD